MPEYNIAQVVVEQIGVLRYAIFINENGKLFLQAMVTSSFDAERRAKGLVDDAMPRNTVDVFVKKPGPSESWKKYGHARMTGDGGSEFIKEK